MRFLSATDAATVKMNGALSTAWQVTIAGSRTITMYNFENGDTITVKITQGTGGNKTVTWPSSVVWPAGAPTLKTSAGATDVFHFRYDGTSFHAIGGARALLNRVTDNRAQSVIGGISVAALSIAVTTGAAAPAPGALPAAINFYAGSGAMVGTGTTNVLMATIDGSGSWIGGQSGALAVGVSDTDDDRYDTGTFYVTPLGNVFAQAISGTTLTIDGNATVSGAITIGNTASFVGAVDLDSNLTVKGTVSGAVVSGGGGDVVMSSTGILKLSNETTYGTLCVDSGSNIGQCSDQPDAVGNCTCVVQ